MRVLVTGAGGFIGSWMVKYLKEKGVSFVRGVDIKYPEFSETRADEFLLLDLRKPENCEKAVKGVSQVYHFAANMGGIGYITSVKADIMRDNVLINANMLEACRKHDVERFLFASSACIYPQNLQLSPQVTGLREEDAFPAYPDSAYGWEKLFTEMMCKAFREDYGLNTRIARYHNIYGPESTYEGGREKAPAALCRKVAMAPDGGKIVIWGDGKQTRSFLYITDCLEATYRLMHSDYSEPLNIGSDRLISIDELADLIIKISGKSLEKVYDLTKPQGVRGRNADLTLIRKVLGWEPKVSYEEGMAKLYFWVEDQIRKKKRS